ncbi:hypothetical protein DL771_008002 [Monosporascus sp. 5C6A]|nr:hypothetical protein DL771_008002 [Monosporascus sp. 5C6A]
MEPFKAIQEPDEGYSEHPLYPSGSTANGNSTALTGVQSHADLPAWLSTQLPSLSVPQKTHLAMLILNELPTTVIADIVMNHLNPRLYINFVEYLPPEICLKIFGYLDPVSLIHVAMCCRGWYDLAVDRKLWEKLYYLEGWKAIHSEISAAEQRMNEGVSYAQLHHQRLQSVDYGHVHKKRAVSDPTLGDDSDLDMVDVEHTPKQEQRDTEMAGSSLFGGPQVVGSGASTKSNGSMVQHMGSLMMHSPSPVPDYGGSLAPRSAKGKGRAVAESVGPKGTSGMVKGVSKLPKSALWIYDSIDGRYKISWKYLYTLRRRLESNWVRGRYTNFQLPHPDYLDEGHNECIYSLQYNSQYLVSGSRDKTIRIWDLHTRRLIRPPLKEHTGSVLCLQFDSDPLEDLIVSGSSDSDVILWRFSTGQVLQRLQRAHKESVLNVKFDKRILVTCSKDKTIKIFNRVPLRPGDLGYGEVNAVNPVPINLRNYGFSSPLDQRPIKPPYTMIGCLEGHGAAVNAVQICGEEIVSASGDRHIKVWDWPNQICRRTFLGHNKGIACVQYDGRRIVSGSSDNEVKVFDRETGLEVASLRAHTNLVRTVQAGFGDLPYSREEDMVEARKVDQAYFEAKEAGRLEEFERMRNQPRNAGSRRPEDITAYGAKLPPGGGGGPYGRIVSGSYDQTVVIWRRDRDGVWKNVHTLRQEEGAANALRQSSRSASTTAPRIPSPLDAQATNPSTPHTSRPVAHPPPHPSASAPPALSRTPNYTHVEQPIHATITPQTTESYTQMIDSAVTQGPDALAQALLDYPTMLTYHSHIQKAIDHEPNAFIRSQLRQVVNTALVRAQLAQNRTMNAVQQTLANPADASESAAHPSTSASSVRQNSYATAAYGGSVASSRRAGAHTFSGHSSADIPPAPPSAYAASAQFGTYASGSRSSNQATSSRQPDHPATGSSATPSVGVNMGTDGGSSSGSAGGPPTTSATIINGTLQHVPQQTTQFHPHHPQQPPPYQHHLQQPQQQQQQQSQPQPQQPQQQQTGPPSTAAAVQPHHPHMGQGADSTNPARIFKLQFDARRIICCSQTSTIVGWDFCNGDPELEEVSRFFGTVE